MKTAWSRYLALVSGVSLLLVAGLALACECDDEGWELIPAWAQGKTTTTNWSDGPIYLCLDAADTTAHFRAVDGEGNDAPEIDWDTNPQGELEWQDHYKYTWHFGDGSDSVGRQVSHVYSAPGAYTVTLTTDDQAEHYDDDSLGVTDDITVYVIKVDLSATDLDGSVTEQNEDPGGRGSEDLAP